MTPEQKFDAVTRPSLQKVHQNGISENKVHSKVFV